MSDDIRAQTQPPFCLQKKLVPCSNVAPCFSSLFAAESNMLTSAFQEGRRSEIKTETPSVSGVQGDSSVCVQACNKRFS